jgi:hypothetical protein
MQNKGQNGSIGCKYYKFINDELNIIRLKRIKNSETVIIIDETNKEERKISTTELKEYTKLIPNGYISASKVALDGNMTDIIVSLHRKKDLDLNDNVPYAVCRQNIFDIFTEQVKKKGDEASYVGVSINKDTCPPNVDYRITLACNDVIEIYTFAVYLSDTFEDIMQFIPELRLNPTLLEMFEKINADERSAGKIRGYCKSIRQLLKENNFMYDFLSAFNIHQVGFKISYNTENSALIPEQAFKLEGLIKKEMIATCVIPFDFDINMKEIKREHIMVSDADEKIYIIAYDAGEYVNREYDAMEDKRDVTLMKDLAAGKKI